MARFLSVDPLTSSYPWYTPYQFAGNKPIWAIDLDGLEEFFVTDKNQPAYKDYHGGTVVKIKDDTWLYTNTGQNFRQIYNTETGWGKRYEYHEDERTGTGLGLSINRYIAEQKSPWGQGVMDFSTMGVAFGLSPVMVTVGSTVGIINYGTLVSSTMEGVASYATGSKYDFFDAFAGGLGVGFYIFATPAIDINHDGVYSAFDGTKRGSDVRVELAINILTFGVGKYIGSYSSKLIQKGLAQRAAGKAILESTKKLEGQLGVNALIKRGDIFKGNNMIYNGNFNVKAAEFILKTNDAVDVLGRMIAKENAKR